MTYLYSIVFGLIQGLTEFLPISSSAHLIFLHDIFKIDNLNNLAFDVFLHLGTLVALVVYFWSDVVRYIRAFFRSLVKFDVKHDADQKLAWLIVLSVIPAGLFGYFFVDTIEIVFRQSLSAAIVLIVVGLAFILIEKLAKKTDDLKQLTVSKTLLIAVFQALALIPGVSRSGITIIAGLWVKLKREEAARFSFLISMPIIFFAGLKTFIDFNKTSGGLDSFLPYLLGGLAAAISGYLAVKYLLLYLKKHSLNIFAVYRIVLGLFIVIYILTR